MRCPSCGHVNPPDARFCNGCGASLNLLATDRMASLRAFIPGEVAEKLLAAGGEGERRTVTALFCDVVGSTALGERLGPERFKVVMDQLLGRLITAVSRYEGTIAQVMGDGLLAFFGAPLTHEDDPERALNAALDIREAVRTYARDLEAAYAASIAVRVGLHTGPVVLSRVTDVLQVAYNALGDTVATAARLQSAAAPGTILASEATAHLVAPLFDLQPLDPLSLNERFDVLVDEAQSCTDNRRRMALYHEADRLLVAEEVAIIPTVYSRRIFLVHPRVKGWWSGIGYRSLSELIVEETE